MERGVTAVGRSTQREGCRPRVELSRLYRLDVEGTYPLGQEQRPNPPHEAKPNGHTSLPCRAPASRIPPHKVLLEAAEGKRRVPSSLPMTTGKTELPCPAGSENRLPNDEPQANRPPYPPSIKHPSPQGMPAATEDKGSQHPSHR